MSFRGAEQILWIRAKKIAFGERVREDIFTCVAEYALADLIQAIKAKTCLFCKKKFLTMHGLLVHLRRSHAQELQMALRRAAETYAEIRPVVSQRMKWRSLKKIGKGHAYIICKDILEKKRL